MSKCLLKLGLVLSLGLVSAKSDEGVQLKYRFSPGQVLRYDGKQTMAVESTVSGTNQKLTYQISSVREWKVLEVDEKGNGRMTMSIVQAQVEATSPDGKAVRFDTEKDGSPNPLASVVGKPLVEVKLSPTGQVLEIQQSQPSAPGQFVALARTLFYPMPPVAVKPGTTWQYDLELPLPPPLGNNETIRIRQTFRLEKAADSVAFINLQSAPAEEIKDKARMARIAQFLPSGRIELDLSRGVLRVADLTLDQTVTDFAGPDSVQRVTGSHREVLKDQLAGSPARPH